MNTPYQRIPDEIAAEVLKEASRLYADSNKGYSPSEVKEACTEVGIPAHIVELAIKNVEDKIALKKANKVRVQERVRKFKQFSQKAFFTGAKLSALAAVIYGLFYFKPHWEPVVSDIVSSFNKKTPEKPLEKGNSEIVSLSTPTPTPEPSQSVQLVDQTSQAPSKTKIDSNEFRRIAKGKTREELIKAVGTPDRTVYLYFPRTNSVSGDQNGIVNTIQINSK
jgi:hypothetical protein